MIDRFAQIKQKYIASFAQKQIDFKKAWGEKDVTQLHHLLHKLSGSSGSYGFDDLCSLCHKAMVFTEEYDIKNTDKIEQYLEDIYLILQNQDILKKHNI